MMQKKSECLFCEIIKEEKNLIYQDEKTAAFLDAFPVSKGHILVVPKIHADTWIETNESDISSTSITAQKIAKNLLKIFPNQIKGFNILINNGREANQMIFHFHIHIIPKFSATQGLQIRHTRDEEEIRNLMQTRKLLQNSLNKKDN